MNGRKLERCSRLLRLAALGLTAFTLGAAMVMAAENAAAQDITVQKVDAIGSSGAPAPADYVSINVDGGSLIQVLNAFAIQTGRNIVVGPNVAVSNGVNLHLNNVRWDEALDVILKPYGFGYRKVGETVVVGKLDEMAGLAAVEPLETRVFDLQYLDAGDVQPIIAGQLSPRGSISVVSARGQTGWAFATMAQKNSSAAGYLGKLQRNTDPNVKESARSKTLIVTDVPSSLSRVAEVLASVDKLPQQVLVEAKIMEVNAALLKDAGLDFSKVTFTLLGRAVGQNIAEGPANPFGDGVNNFNGQNYSVNMGAVAIINLLQQDTDTKVLSAPRILTMNNQEATIIVGEKFPIIKSELDNNNSGGNPTKTTQLEYYEPSGIQLTVVPQICAGGYVGMIVHPAISSFIGFETVEDDGEVIARYPIISIRETETQILMKSGQTGVIGGLLEDRKIGGVQKIPVLGSIPLLGRLFRNETADDRTIDLLIFLSATIVDEKNYDAVIAEKTVSNDLSGQAEAVAESKPATAPSVEAMVTKLTK